MPHSEFANRAKGKPSTLSEIENLPRLNTVDAALALRLSFDLRYDLRPHPSVSNRPFGLVEMYEAERIEKNDLTFSTLKRYAAAKINDIFGLNYVDFISLPSYMVKFMFEIAEAQVRRSEGAMDELTKAMAAGKPKQ